MLQLRVVGGALSEAVIGRLAPAIRVSTLEDVLHWCGDVIEVIVQDEYTHDVIVRGPASAYLCFDTT